MLQIRSSVLEAAARIPDPAAGATADAVADLGDKAANSGPKIGDMSGALDDAEQHLWRSQ